MSGQPHVHDGSLFAAQPGAAHQAGSYPPPSTACVAPTPYAGAPSAQFSAPPQVAEEPQRNVYVRNIPAKVSAEEFRQIFEPFGEVESHKLMVDIQTGAPRGFGFVLFRRHEDAVAAVMALNGFHVHGRELSVRLADRKTRPPGEPTCRVFLRNLPPGITDADVAQLCAPDGAVQQVILKRDDRHGHQSLDKRGQSFIAHVEMQTVESAQAVVRRLNNSTVFADSIPAPLQAKVVDVTKRGGGSTVTSPSGATGETGRRDSQAQVPQRPIQLPPQWNGLPGPSRAPIFVPSPPAPQQYQQQLPPQYAAQQRNPQHQQQHQHVQQPPMYMPHAGFVPPNAAYEQQEHLPHARVAGQPGSYHIVLAQQDAPHSHNPSSPGGPAASESGPQHAGASAAATLGAQQHGLPHDGRSGAPPGQMMWHLAPHQQQARQYQAPPQQHYQPQQHQQQQQQQPQQQQQQHHSHLGAPAAPQPPQYAHAHVYGMPQ